MGFYNIGWVNNRTNCTQTINLVVKANCSCYSWGQMFNCFQEFYATLKTDEIRLETVCQCQQLWSDHVYYRWTRSTYRSTVARYIGRLSVDYRSTIGRRSVDNRPTIGRLSTDYRSIVVRSIGRQSTDKCVDRYSLKPSILDRYMTDT